MTHIELEVEIGVFIMKHVDDIREVGVHPEGTMIICQTFHQKLTKGKKPMVYTGLEHMIVLNDYNDLRAQLTGNTIVKPQANLKLTK